MTAVEFLNGKVVLHPGDCLASVKAMPDACIDAVVTDPPYALVSITKRFGKAGATTASTDAYARAASGFMGKQWDTGEVAFAVEFWREILRVLKPGGHVVAFSGTRTYHRLACAIEDAGFEIRDQLGWLYGTGFPKSHNLGGEWQGWGTALKPAWEPVVFARKPLDGTVAANVLSHGTGAINIDACRVGSEVREAAFTSLAPCKGNRLGDADTAAARRGTQGAAKTYVGRHPANILHDGSPEVLEAFPDAPGQQRYTGPEYGQKVSVNCFGDYGPIKAAHPRNDSGSAARFFYSAKADADDRIGSKHPTVKPVDLMRWLCRLITPPGGVVLDPFAGTGTTGEAAFLEGFRAVLCEREEEYQADIARRMALVLAERFGANLPGEISLPLPPDAARPLGANGVPNYGDMTQYKDWPDADIDVLVGGTPCQAFSVAGLRKGLDDPRGNLTLVYLGLVKRYRPRWVVWENVPGVLSIDGGRAFASFLGGLGQLGYGWAYRVLDAQFCRVDGYPRAVPQRRRRVFVVGHSSGDFRRAAGVLLEPEGLRGDSAPRREAGEGVAADVAPSLVSSGRGVERAGDTRGQDAVVAVQAFGGGNTSGAIDAAACLTAKGQRVDFEVETFVAHALRAEGFDASEDGTGRGTPLVPIAFPERMSATQYGAMEGVLPALGALNPTAVAFAENSRGELRLIGGDGGVSSQLTTGGGKPGQGQPCVAFAIQERAVSENPNAGPDGIGVQADIAYTLEARQQVQAVSTAWAVRRLTPTECERLQGFPDGWTAIARKNGKPAADGPRYKALGNSMAVNVMRWIGQRIALMDEVP